MNFNDACLLLQSFVNDSQLLMLPHVDMGQFLT